MWQQEPCPPWCATEHHETDLVDDRIHDSVGAFVSAALAPRDAQPSTEPQDLIIAAYRHFGSEHTWVYVGETVRDGMGLTLSPESAARLGQALSTFSAGIE